MKKIYGKNARVWYYKIICSGLVEIYNAEKKYMFDMPSLAEFKQQFC